MKIVYFLKGLKNIPQLIQNFVERKIKKVEKLTSEEGEGILEIEMSKSRENKDKKAMIYKVKLLFDTPKRHYLIVWGWGKNFYQALNDAFKKLVFLIKKKK